MRWGRAQLPGFRDDGSVSLLGLYKGGRGGAKLPLHNLCLPALCLLACVFETLQPQPLRLPSPWLLPLLSIRAPFSGGDHLASLWPPPKSSSIVASFRARLPRTNG